MLAGQLPQECEGDGEVDQEGAAGDGGGEEEGGGKTTSTGAIGAKHAFCKVFMEKVLMEYFCAFSCLIFILKFRCIFHLN